MKNRNTIQAWLLAGALFAAAEILLILFADRPLSEYLRTVDSTHHALIDFFRIWTDLGLGKWYEWPSGIGALLCLGLSAWEGVPAKKRKLLRREGHMLAFFFVSVTLAGIATDILKPIAGRARPVLLDREDYYGFHPLFFHSSYNSFPSGHTATVFAAAFALIALWPRSLPWLMIFAVAIGISRVMINAHYLSDVFAGAAIGWLTALLVQRLFAQRGWLAFPASKG